MEKEWKEFIKKARNIKGKESPLCCIDALMDIRHLQNYEYIPVNVRESNLKCGN